MTCTILTQLWEVTWLQDQVSLTITTFITKLATSGLLILLFILHFILCFIIHIILQFILHLSLHFIFHFNLHFIIPFIIHFILHFFLHFSYAPNVHTNATIHSATNPAAHGVSAAAPGYNYDYATQSAANEWNRVSLASSQGPPGYPITNSMGGSSIKTNPQLLPESSMSTTTPADSVLELKRGLKNQSPATTSTSEDGSSRGSSSGMHRVEITEIYSHAYLTKIS